MEEREERSLRDGKKFSDSWFVSLVAFFLSSVCGLGYLAGRSVGLYVVVAGNNSCRRRRRGLVAACSMVVRE